MIRFSLQVAVYLIALSFLLLGGSHAEDLQGIRSIRDLDQASILHYAIFSDNKGESPASSVEFARMADWVRAGESAFVVGVGDHLKYGCGECSCCQCNGYGASGQVGCCRVVSSLRRNSRNNRTLAGA